MAKIDPQEVVLHRSPILTVKHSALELIHSTKQAFAWLLTHLLLCIILVLTAAFYFYIRQIDGPHSFFLQFFEKKVTWSSFWVVLGVLSSIGLGSGLHTFVLYLGPHIAKVTLAAYECGTLDFQEPPYPNEIQCPSGSVTTSIVDLSSIMSKVRLEAFMWGLGTAIGELPPYLMARTARLSGQRNSGVPEGGLQAKVETFVKQVGFFAVLASASIPNPLFDIVGFTCGYSLMPFWTFFGATAIGKAIIKINLQKIFVIVSFSEKHFEDFLAFLRNLSILGETIGFYFEEFLQKQKTSLHVLPGLPIPEVSSSPSLLSSILEWIVTATVLYFLLTIINSLAQQNVIRSQKPPEKKDRKKEPKKLI